MRGWSRPEAIAKVRSWARKYPKTFGPRVTQIQSNCRRSLSANNNPFSGRVPNEWWTGSLTHLFEGSARYQWALALCIFDLYAPGDPVFRASQSSPVGPNSAVPAGQSIPALRPTTRTSNQIKCPLFMLRLQSGHQCYACTCDLIGFSED